MDNLFQELGHCGKFQVCHVTLVQLCRFVTAWAFSVMIFGLYNPGWKCVQTIATISKLSNFSDNIHHGINTSLKNNTCANIDSCTEIKFSTSSSTVVTEFVLICDRVWIGYIIVTLLSAGMLVGNLIWGHIGETFGRKVSLYGSVLTMSVSSGLAVFSPTWYVYAIFTFFIGIGTGNVTPVVNILCIEFLNSKWRSVLTAIPTWNFGIMCFTLLTFFLRDWKYIHLTVAVSGGLSCLGFLRTSESLRWLVIHGKARSAEKVVVKISKMNSHPVPLNAFNEIMDKNVNERRNGKYSYIDLFKARDMRILTIKLSLLRVVSVLTYDSIGFGIQSLPGNFYINFLILGLVESFFCVAVGILAQKLGRRWSGIIFLTGGFICCASIIISLLALGNIPIRAHIVTGMAITNRAFITGFVILNHVYAGELVPTAVRNLSLGFFETVGRVSGMLGPYLIPRDYHSMVACFAVLMVAQATATVVVSSLTETKKSPLKDVLDQDFKINLNS